MPVHVLYREAYLFKELYLIDIYPKKKKSRIKFHFSSLCSKVWGTDMLIRILKSHRKLDSQMGGMASVLLPEVVVLDFYSLHGLFLDH